MHSSVSTRHAKLLTFLEVLLQLYIERHDLGALFREVVAVRLSGRNVFLPDLAYYRAERSAAIRETWLEGPPDLVVEVLSPSTADRDVGTKFVQYEEHGVREYWILDPESLAHRFYRRHGNGEFVEFASGEETIASEVVPGFVLRRAWLDPSALPKVDIALREIER